MFIRKDAKIFSVPDWSDTSTKTYDLTTVEGREQVPINLSEIKGLCFIYVRENNEYYRLISDTTSGTTRTLVFNGTNKITITATSTTMTIVFSAGEGYVYGETDDTLTLSGVAADAKATGDTITATKDEINSNITTVNGEINKNIKSDFNTPFVSTTSAFNVTAGGMNPNNGANLPTSTYPMTCKLGYTAINGTTIMVICDNPNFKYNVWGYSNLSASSAVKTLTNNAYVPPGTPVIIPSENNISHFRIGFYKIDGTNVTEQDIADIEDSISTYQKIDKSLTVNGGTPDSKIVGDKFAGLEKTTSGNKYEVVQRIAVAYGVTAMCFIGNKLFVFPYNENNSGRIYTPNNDGTLPSEYGTFTSNIGHRNSVDYSNGNGYLIAGNGGEDNNIYLIPATENTTYFDKDDSNTVIIDMSSIPDIGHDGYNVCWGNDNIRKYDMMYLISRDDTNNIGYISLIQLGKGINNLGSGTLIEDKTDTQFNGTYQVINTLTRTLEVVNGISDHNNDCTYYDGKIYEVPAPSSPSGFAMIIHSFINFNTAISTEKIFIPYRSTSGSTVGQEREGIAIKNHRMYLGTHSGGFYIHSV